MDGKPTMGWLYKGQSGYWFMRIECVDSSCVVYAPVANENTVDRLQLAGWPLWEDHSDYMKTRR
jgi:hypothetical protein